MENMRKTKLLPRKRRMKEKKSKLARVSLSDKSAYLHRILIEKMLADAKKILGL